MAANKPTQAEAYEPPAVSDLPTDGPSSVCAMIVVISPSD
jgi:hypothetical protein